MAEAEALLLARARGRRLLCASVYVSCSGGEALGACRAAVAAAGGGSRLAALREFVDAAYGRTGLTLAVDLDAAAGGAEGSAPLVAAIDGLAAAVGAHVDLRLHAASHPRLGALDHVLVSPLGAAALGEAAAAARGCAEAIAARGVPVAAYGALAEPVARLADVRRALGYFRGAGAGAFSSGVDASLAAAHGDLLAYGPRAPHPALGVACVGAAPFVVNYNVPLATGDLGLARRCARAVSERGGGLNAVEAAGLPHGEGGVEVACNLLDFDGATDDEAVQRAVEAHVRERRPEVAVGRGYRTNFTPSEAALQASMALGGG